MKKRIFSILLVMLFALGLAVSASAEEREIHVFDIDDLLDAGAVSTLETLAAQVSEDYECGVYIAIFGDMADYGYDDIEEFSEEVFRTWDLGYGEQNNGILLVLSMNDRDYDLDAFGDFANYAFTDYGKSELADLFLDDFRENDWFPGFVDYVEGCETFLAKARDGEPVDIYYESYAEPRVERELTPQERFAEEIGPAMGFGLVAGIIAALIRCGMLKKKMKSAIVATEASDYVSDHGVAFTARENHFTHTTVVRQRIQQESSSRSGGGFGGTSVGSSGHSHSSGKF